MVKVKAHGRTLRSGKRTYVRGYTRHLAVRRDGKSITFDFGRRKLPKKEKRMKELYDISVKIKPLANNEGAELKSVVIPAEEDSKELSRKIFDMITKEYPLQAEKGMGEPFRLSPKQKRLIELETKIEMSIPKSDSDAISKSLNTIAVEYGNKQAIKTFKKYKLKKFGWAVQK